MNNNPLTLGTMLKQLVDTLAPIESNTSVGIIITSDKHVSVYKRSMKDGNPTGGIIADFKFGEAETIMKDLLTDAEVVIVNHWKGNQPPKWEHSDFTWEEAVGLNDAEYEQWYTFLRDKRKSLKNKPLNGTPH